MASGIARLGRIAVLRGLVIGGADCVWADITAATALFEPDAYFVINDMITLWPGPCDYACSLHAEKIPEWIRRRAHNGYPAIGEVWCHKLASGRGRQQGSGVDRLTPDWAGSSGLFACKVAIQEKFDRIVVCGVPLDAAQNHIDRHRPWNAANAFRGGWKTRKKLIAPYVRSMSGFTKDLLGGPTADWLGLRITH